MITAMPLGLCLPNKCIILTSIKYYDGIEINLLCYHYP